MRQIIFDTETNGVNADDAVLSFAALEVIDGVAVRTFERYYFLPPGHRENIEALRINGLWEDVIEENREEQGAEYPEHFGDDRELIDAISGADLYIAHNFDFDAALVKHWHGVDFEPNFCTMKATQYLYGATVFKNGEPKWPRLSEAWHWAARVLQDHGIEPIVEAGEFHESLFDCWICWNVYRALEAIGKAPAGA